MAEYRLCNHPDEDHEWQDAMRARREQPVRADYSSEGSGGSPIPSLQRMLIALYAAEVDFSVHSAWDAGVQVTVHKPRSDGITTRLFSYGKAAHDFPDASSMWDAVVFFICETVVRDWDNLEDGAPVDVGCLSCTMNTTPVNLTTGECVYHIADHVLKTHGLKPHSPRPKQTDCTGETK